MSTRRCRLKHCEQSTVGRAKRRVASRSKEALYKDDARLESLIGRRTRRIEKGPHGLDAAAAFERRAKLAGRALQRVGADVLGHALDVVAVLADEREQERKLAVGRAMPIRDRGLSCGSLEC